LITTAATAAVTTTDWLWVLHPALMVAVVYPLLGAVLHLAANLLATLIFLAQGISGSRDLLEIPLSWQKPVIYSCDAIRQICPAAQPPG